MSITKLKKLAEKKLNKFKEQIKKSSNLILEDNIPKALENVKQMLLSSDLIDNFQFEGYGNIENWKHQYPEGPLQWLRTLISQKQYEINPFDLLNICLTIHFHEGRSLSEIESEYMSLQQEMEGRVQLSFGLGNIYYSNQNYLKAESIYLKIEQTNLERETTYSQKLFEYLAFVSYHFQLKQKVQHYCGKCLQINKENMNSLFLRLLCLENKSFNQIQELKQLGQKYPEFYRIYVGIGDVSFGQESISFYKKALEHEPGSSEILAKIADIYVSYEQFEEAGKCVEEIEARTPLSSLVEKLKAEILVGKEQYLDATLHFKQAIRVSPFNFEYLYSLGSIYHNELKELALAIRNYSKYLQLNPYNVSVYMAIGQCYEQMQFVSEALKFYENGLKINGNSDEICHRIADLERESGNYFRALEMLIRANQIRPTCREYWFDLAECYKQLKRYHEAEKWALACKNSGDDWVKEEIDNLLEDIRLRMMKRSVQKEDKRVEKMQLRVRRIVPEVRK